MSNFVRFYFDRNRKLNYSALIQDEAEFGKGIEAESTLANLDLFKYSNYKISGGNLILYNKHFSLIFEDYKFFKHMESQLKPGQNLWSVCPRIRDNMNATMKQRKINKQKRRNKLEKAAAGVFLSSIVAISLIVGVKLSKNLDSYQEVPPMEDIKIEMQVENDNVDYLDKFEESYEIQEEVVQEEPKYDGVILEGAANLTESEKAIYAKENWYDVVSEFAETYGISANLPMAVLTQETGGFEEFKNNIMQIEFPAWEDQVVKCFNFKTNETEQFVLSNNPSKYDDGITVYTKEDLKDPVKNIEAAIKMMRYNIVNQDYNSFLGLYTYNMGFGNMNKIIGEYLRINKDLSIDDIMNDPIHINGLIDVASYTVNAGDYNYPYNVGRYMEDNEVWIKTPGQNSEIISQQFQHGKGLS